MTTAAEIEAENDETMNGWLDDMIFSGDMAGYLRRQATELLCTEFVDYLIKRVSETDDPDEKAAANDALRLVKQGMDLTDGLGQAAGVAFEKRLDNILFTPPNQRKAYINEISSEVSPGFIEYVQKELKDIPDQDSKVVLASILKIIGEVKNQDALGGASILLAQADESLGEEYKKKDDPLANELGNELMLRNRNEQILGSLMFSENDIVEDILNNLHEIDERFTSWLGAKVDSTSDLEERVALTSLLETINSILEKVTEAQGEAVGPIDEEFTMEQVRLKMQEVQMGATLTKKEVGKVKEVFNVQEDKKSTFYKILKMIQRSMSDGQTLEEGVLTHYDLCDYQFMENLKAEASSDNPNNDLYMDILAEISRAMAKKIGTAQERLQLILMKRQPKAMESEIILMARKGEVDEALILLMEANAQQAMASGAVQAAEVLQNLIKRANSEREKKLPDEQRLLRALVKLTNSEERKGLLYAAFKPVKNLVETEQGPRFVEGQPLITPPIFINCVRNFIKGFGNVDSFNIMDRAQAIVDEAQEVATELYGEGMSPRQQQEFMLKQNTVSIWDLANYEEKALTSGEDVPWAGDPQFDDMSPEDVLGEIRKRKIGGESEDITHKY